MTSVFDTKNTRADELPQLETYATAESCGLRVSVHVTLNEFPCLGLARPATPWENYIPPGLQGDVIGAEKPEGPNGLDAESTGFKQAQTAWHL